MAMSVGGGGEDEPMMDINTTPLIDVMLVLLIMFIITIPVMTHAVKLDMPQSERTRRRRRSMVEPIQLEIDFDGTMHLERHPGAARYARRLLPPRGGQGSAAGAAHPAEHVRTTTSWRKRAGARAAQRHAAHRLRRQRTVHGMTLRG